MCRCVLLTSCRCFVNQCLFPHSTLAVYHSLFLPPYFFSLIPLFILPSYYLVSFFMSMPFSLFFSLSFHLSSVACPPQQFKSIRSNTEACHSCPRNSYANTNGSNVCMCSAGYYRTSSETSDEPCTGE